MADPFLGEIKMFSFNWAPRGWALCDGRSMQTNQNAALFALVSTQFGGNNTAFNLPDLRGRTPVASGDIYSTGKVAGAETVTLTETTMPPHSHVVYGSNEDGVKFTAAGANDILGVVKAPIYSADTGTNVAMNAGTVSSAGGTVAHNNMQPSLVMNFCIALVGTFPSRN